MTHLQKDNFNHIPCQLPGVCLNWTGLSERLDSDRKEEKFRKIRKTRQIQKIQTNSDQNSDKFRKIQTNSEFRPKFRQIQKNSDKFRQIQTNIQTNSEKFRPKCGLNLSEFWSEFV